MALKIRLRQQGRTNRQTYRLVVTDIRNPRDGKYLEMVGWYNPFDEKQSCHVDQDRIQYWMGLGATLTPNATTIVKKAAPEIVRAISEKKQARLVKEAAKRRALKKK